MPNNPQQGNQGGEQKRDSQGQFTDEKSKTAGGGQQGQQGQQGKQGQYDQPGKSGQSGSKDGSDM